VCEQAEERSDEVLREASPERDLAPREGHAGRGPSGERSETEPCDPSLGGLKAAVERYGTRKVGATR